MYEAGQIFAYEIKENSAIIWRCFSRDTKAEIPEYVEGCPVTEVAPYAFSAHMGSDEIQRGLASGRLRVYVPELYRKEEAGSAKLPQGIIGQGRGDIPELPQSKIQVKDGILELPQDEGGGGKGFPALCGDVLEEIVFPAALRRVGRYCFYNCGHLHKITFSGGLSDWGSGVFTGCHQVQRLRVYTDAAGKSYLKDVLDELPEALQVEYYVPDGAPGQGEMPGQSFGGLKAGNYGTLVFPGFYEEGVENTPARILETRVHGSGIRYRNCFNSRKFDFHQYDVLFPHAKAQEPPEVVGRLAMNRLRYPLELADRARDRYEEYVREHGTELADMLLAEQDLEGIKWLLDLVKSEAEGADSSSEPGPALLLDYMTEQAAGRHLTEIMSFLMDYRRVNTPAARKKKRLEL